MSCFFFFFWLNIEWNAASKWFGAFCPPFLHRLNWKSESPSQVWELVPPCLWTVSPWPDLSPRRTGKKHARDLPIRACLTCRLSRTCHPKSGSGQKGPRQQTHNLVSMRMAKVRNAWELKGCEVWCIWTKGVSFLSHSLQHEVRLFVKHNVIAVMFVWRMCLFPPWMNCVNCLLPSVSVVQHTEEDRASTGPESPPVNINTENLYFSHWDHAMRQLFIYPEREHVRTVRTTWCKSVSTALFLYLLFFFF